MMSEPTGSEKPTILVTGASGFIGSHVARALVSRGYSVRAMRRADSEMRFVEDLAVDWVYGDLDDSQSVGNALHGCQGVMHCAGFYPSNGLDIEAARRVGVGQMRRLFEQCLAQKILRVVYVSSPATLGFRPADPSGRLDETDYYVPGTLQNAYFEAKWAMEAEIYRYMLRGLGAVIAIPGAVFGPGDARPTTGQFLLRLARGRAPGVIGDTLNVVDVRDLADTLVRAMERGRPGRRYVIGGRNIGVDEFAASVSKIAEVPGPRLHLPAAPVRRLARLAERVGRRFGLDTPAWVVGADLLAYARPLHDERARAELTHTSRPTRVTLSDAIAWFGENGYL